MDNLEESTPAEPTGQMVEQTCWECGAKKECIEYVVCCTGTLFHVCPECEANLQTDAEPGEGEALPASAGAKNAGAS